jgi:non-canonical (house-cleaning) NTP pyrophosphatase
MKYPIYRKFQNGHEFHKVVSDTQFVSVSRHKKGFRILITENAMMRNDVFDESVSMESNRNEFEKVFGEAMWALNKANTVI